MQLTAGTKLKSAVSSTELIVVRAPDVDVVVTCGGEPMIGDGEAVPERADATLEGSALLGKRYTDEATGIELLCTKGGPGELACDGRPLVLLAAKALPSSD